VCQRNVVGSPTVANAHPGDLPEIGCAGRLPSCVSSVLSLEVAEQFIRSYRRSSQHARARARKSRLSSDTQQRSQAVYLDLEHWWHSG